MKGSGAVEEVVVIPKQTRRRHYLDLERLEDRLALAAGALPVDTIGIATGAVIGPGGVGSAAVAVAPGNLATGRSSTVIGVAVTPASGVGLQPRIKSVFGPGGERLPFYQQGSLGAKLGGPATVLVLDDQPGPITVNVAGRGRTTGAFQLRVYLPGDVDGSGHVDNADLQAIAPAYLSRTGDPNYVAAADPLQTGKVGQQAVRLIERNLSNPAPNRPLGLIAYLPPSQQAAQPNFYNSGPVTTAQTVTVIGQTLPNSAVFLDGYYGLYNFNGPFIPTDGQGNFRYTFTPRGKLDTTVNFLVIAPDGRQLIRNFPIYRIGLTFDQAEGTGGGGNSASG